MSTTFEAFTARLPEDDCLAEVMRLRHGGAPCPACERRAGFTALPKHRALACSGCGFRIYPCEGTPLAKPALPLQHWFYAVHLRAGGQRLAPRTVARAIGCPMRSAEQLVAQVSTLERGGDRGGAIDWFTALSGFATERLAASPAGLRAEPVDTVWSTFVSLFRVPDLDRHRHLGTWLIVGLVSAALGVGWMMVPSDSADETDVAEEATALLALSGDSAVIVVSQEVANQLYDVSDADPSPGTAPAPVIRAAPAGVELKRIEVGEARPLSRPSVKLSPSVGDSILRGDLASAKRGAEARPELAAYASLATALDAKDGANPDEVLTFGPMRIRRHLVEKIVRAARETSMDPVLLMAIADKESSFVTEVQAQTSSATGLFQFIEKTWFGVVRDFGPAHGLVAEAQAVTGDLPAAERIRILNLRRDAYLSAIFAAEMLKRDSESLARVLGRKLTGGEVYLIHFLGPDGAKRLLTRAATAPEQAAAELLPKPAAANQTIFYAPTGGGTRRQLSVTDVRDKFETMIGLRLNRYRDVHAVARPGSGPLAPVRAEAAPPPAR